MAKTTALVPIPYYPLVRADSSTPDQYHHFRHQPEHAVPLASSAASQPISPTTYTREALPVADRLIGTRVDIYV